MSDKTKGGRLPSAASDEGYAQRYRDNPPPSPERRRFLTGTAAVGMAAGAGGLFTGGRELLASNPDSLPPNVPDWSRYLGAGVDAYPYGAPVEFESHVVRRSVEWLTATTESSVNFTPIHEMDGFVTPNGLCFERHHGGMAIIPPDDYRLMINGLVERPLIFTLQDLMRFPPESRFHFLECAANSGMEWRGAQLNGVQYTHGMIHCVYYTGVPLKTLLNEAGIKTSGKWILAEGADSSGMTRSIPLEKALDDCLVAYSQNGERLRAEQGYPIRLVVPGWEGNMWVKWLRRLEVGDQPWYHREETSKYTDLLPDGSARKFTWTMDAKSVITSPSPEKPMLSEGPQVIKGLAWSGHGKIARVDVSTDGGINWQPARLHEPVLSKSLTFFSLPWSWSGGEALLQSRAVDDTGYVQPQMAALQEARGVNSIYHNNSVQTWLVNANGAVDNVRLG
ncbi:sulfite dehydrogenase [Algihabitans sp.]|uniref:sulfite dehydrogenase n=1 Tax=Algihabitans sp. TaxID=2821514 RepID=UPI003BAB93BC